MALIGKNARKCAQKKGQLFSAKIPLEPSFTEDMFMRVHFWKSVAHLHRFNTTFKMFKFLPDPSTNHSWQTPSPIKKLGDVWFRIRIQLVCAENYYGPLCAIHCKPEEHQKCLSDGTLR